MVRPLYQADVAFALCFSWRVLPQTSSALMWPKSEAADRKSLLFTIPGSFMIFTSWGLSDGGQGVMGRLTVKLWFRDRYFTRFYCLQMFSVSLGLTFFLSSVSLCPEFSLLPVASSVERNQKAERNAHYQYANCFIAPRKNAGTWQSLANLPRGAVRETLASHAWFFRWLIAGKPLKGSWYVQLQPN